MPDWWPKHEVLTCKSLGCAAYDKLAERIKELEAVIEKYARHTYECGLRFDHEHEISPCDCGFERAMKG